jgi:hypothetical protein
MAMLVHDFERASRSKKSPVVKLGATKTRLATIKRLCAGVLPILLATFVLAGIVALKTAIYFERFSFGAG